ncbi:LPS export ABC transporter periplasmic protein LptC [Azotosporobacter soli]|uniref:LPS export ABC transporter periplasmic protein LptC n=1 Tax=Azotosporobacter soli TaxID=3055040 RepID=UPI0031FE930E
MKKANWLIGCAIVLLLAWGIYYFLRPEAPAAEKEALPSKAPTFLTYEGNTISEEKDGRKIWQVTAETIEIDVDSSNLRVKNVKATFFQENGTQIVLTAPEGNMDHNSKDIALKGSVHAVTSDGATFTAQEANWQAKDGLFTATGQVKLTREDTVVTGDRLDTDGKLEKIKVQGNAHVVKGGAK